MKTLTKIKLINWQGFYDETVDVRGSILVTGENGSGKSSLIDALYFLLTGGDTDYFNAAANDKNDRTIETYMRGHTGEVDHPDLRTEPSVVSHIALEFFDEEAKKYFVIGAVLEIQEGKARTGRDFYHFKDTKMTEDLFSTEIEGKKVYLNFAAMKKRFKDLNDLGDAKKDIRRALYSILSLEGGKYYELLPKAVSFKPIDDVDSFVYRFLMPEKNVSIEGIRANIRTYNNTLAIVETDKAKQTILENIIHRGDEYKEALLNRKLCFAYQKKRQIDRFNDSITSCQRKITEEKARQEGLNTLKAQISDQLDELKESKYAIEHQEAYIRIKEIKDKLDGASKELRRLADKATELSQDVLKEKEIATVFRIQTRFSHAVAEEDFAELKGELEAYKAKLDAALSENRQAESDLKGELNDLKDQQSKLMARRDSLKKGIPDYDPKVTSLKEVIQAGLKRKYGVDVEPKPFCELLEIPQENEEWRNAIEGYLNTRRFDLFVPKEYFDEALRLYERYKTERHISGVGLVDVAKLKDDKPLEGSLAEKVTALTEDAGKYASYILGQVICVDSEDELKKYPCSITKTVMVYRNKAARQTRPEVYRTPYIGLNSIKIQLEQVENELKEVGEKMPPLEAKAGELRQLIKLGEGNDYSRLSKIENYWQQKIEKEKEVSGLQTQYDSLKENVGKLTAQVNAIDDKIDGLKKQQTNADESEKASIASSTKAEEELKGSSAGLEKANGEFLGMMRDRQISAQLDSFIAENPLNDGQLQSHIGNYAQTIDSDSRAIIAQMSEYITKFSFDARVDMDSLDGFYQEYNNVVKRHLAEYEDRLNKVKEEAKTTFQNSYIAEIRNNINNEIRNIKDLNKILKDKPFGSSEEIYQFEISKAKNPTFAPFYEIFRSNEDYSIKDLFTEQLSTSNMELMNDLFKRLTADTKDEKSMKVIQDFTDYRKFMSYDIIITNKYGKSYRFSKINKSKSGGETQTPFYVIIAASFDQIVKSGYSEQSKGCIVMFDEAFEKMDEAHVDSMMQFFRKLSIQPIIAVPSRNAKPIFPYVDTTIGLVKIKDRIFPRPRFKES